MEHRLTDKEKLAVDYRNAHGKLILLAVGISDYSGSDFSVLKTCASDAEEIKQCLLEIHQLNADNSRLQVLTSKTVLVPSKGEIFRALKAIVAASNAEDRLMFFYSGHGHRFPNDDSFYLVPQDAYEASPEALLDFNRVEALLDTSPAKQKIIVLDACLSGPSLSKEKAALATYSKKFLTKYMRNTKGSATLTSSTENEKSYTQSPNPKLSLFTHYFSRALRGEPAALDGQLLTLSSLYEYVSGEVQRRATSYQLNQTPGLDVAASGVFILGDFSTSIIPPGQLDLSGYPVIGIEFEQAKHLTVSDVLTNIKSFRYSQEYLESRVNSNLDDHLRDDFGSKASSVRRAMGWTLTDVVVEGTAITFPGGRFSAEYIADSLKSGSLMLTISFDEDWFDRPGQIARVIEVFDMNPDEVRFALKKAIKPLDLIPGLESRKWRTTSELPEKVEASQGGREVRIEEHTIAFDGFTTKSFLEQAKGQDAQLAAGVLSLLLG